MHDQQSTEQQRTKKQYNKCTVPNILFVNFEHQSHDTNSFILRLHLKQQLKAINAFSIFSTCCIIGHRKYQPIDRATNFPTTQVNLCYNITKARRVLWLANSASTICPWVYAADVLKNQSKARALWWSSICCTTLWPRNDGYRCRQEYRPRLTTFVFYHNIKDK